MLLHSQMEIHPTFLPRSSLPVGTRNELLQRRVKSGKAEQKVINDTSTISCNDSDFEYSTDVKTEIQSHTT